MSGLGADLFVPLHFSERGAHAVTANAGFLGSLAASSSVDPATGATFITIPAVGLAAVLVLLNILTSIALKLGLEGQLLIATIRCEQTACDPACGLQRPVLSQNSGP